MTTSVTLVLSPDEQADIVSWRWVLTFWPLSNLRFGEAMVTSFALSVTFKVFQSWPDVAEMKARNFMTVTWPVDLWPSTDSDHAVLCVPRLELWQHVFRPFASWFAPSQAGFSIRGRRGVPPCRPGVRQYDFHWETMLSICCVGKFAVKQVLHNVVD